MLRRSPVPGPILALCLALAGPLVHAQAPDPAPTAPPLHIRQLHDDLYVIDGTSTGDTDVPNLMVYVTAAGVVLVDPWFAKDHDRVLAAVKSVTDLPIRYILNTHFHADHTGSNGLFAQTTDIVGQANTRKHMLDHNLPGAPNLTFTDQLTFFLGGKEVRLLYLGRGHTDGDAAIYFPEWKTICLGDMMAGTRGVTNPVVDYANGGSLAAWPASLERALALPIDAVVPGHGALTTRAQLLIHRNKIQAVADRLRTLDAQHKSTDEIRSTLLSEFDFKPINLRALDSLIAEFKQ